MPGENLVLQRGRPSMRSYSQWQARNAGLTAACQEKPGLTAITCHQKGGLTDVTQADAASGEHGKAQYSPA